MISLFVLATFSCLVDLLASATIKVMTSWCFNESKEEQALRSNLSMLKKEMSSISMVDEFSKYAKLQRKFNKLKDEAKVTFDDRSASRMKLRLSLTFGVRVINGILTSILLFLYRREPVMIFPSGSLWPLESFLSWPTTVDSCISLPTWIILMRLSISSVSKLLS